MLTVYVLVAVFLLASGQTSVETSQFASAEDCKAGAEALRAFLTTHETDIASATWSCTSWELTQPKIEQPLPKRNL